MKSKISSMILLCLFIVVGIAGCGTSSTPEEIAVVKNLPDFKDVVQTMSLSGSFYAWTEVDEANPVFEKKNSTRMLANRIIVYRTKSDSLRIATINRTRPPAITGLSQEFK